MKQFLTILVVLALSSAAAYGGWHYRQSHQTKPGQSTVATTSSQSPDYLVVKEWGVKFKLSDDIKDAIYTYKDQKIIAVSTSKIRDIKGCEKVDVLEIQRGMTEDFIGPTKVSELLANNPASLKKLDDYYYALIPSPNSCAAPSDAAGADLLVQTKTEFASAVKTVGRSD